MEKDKKEESLKEEIIRLTKQRTYLWCVVIIIGFFVVNQFSLMFCSNQVIVEQFSFASTISSIILSVIAIIMSVVSSDSINSLLHKFRDLHDEIKDVPVNIDSSLTVVNEESKKLGELYESIKEVPREISESVGLMKDTSKTMTESTVILSVVSDEIKKHTALFTNMKEELKAEIQARLEPSAGKSDSSVKMGDVGIYNSIVDHGSYFGNLLIYAAIIAEERQKRLTLVDFSYGILNDSRYVDYFFGYMIMLIASGAVSAETMQKTFMIKSVKCEKAFVRSKLLAGYTDDVKIEKYATAEEVISKIEQLFS